MAYTPRRLVGPYNLIDDYQTVLLADAKTILRQIILSNVTGNAANVRLNITAFSGTPSSTNAILQDVEIEANSTLIMDVNQVLEPLERLHARASVSGSINITVSGLFEE